MAAGLDWMWYLGAALLGALGLWLLYWSLFRDRARGRRRCPKCWYDMSATPGLVCSECGHAAKRERKLFKTRRRWRGAGLGAAVVLLSGIGAATPGLMRHGPARYAPTTLLIMLMPDLTRWNQKASLELSRRAAAGRLYGWQWSWLLDRTHDSAQPLWTIAINARARWPADVPLYGEVDCVWSPALAACRSEALRMRLIPCFDESAAVALYDGGAPTSVQTPSGLRVTSLGMPPAGATDLEFRVVLESRRGAPAADRGDDRGWAMIREGSVRLALPVAGKLEDHIVQDGSAELTRQLWNGARLILRNSFLRIESDWGFRPPRDFTCPVTVELLRDDEVMLTQELWWCPEYGSRRILIPAWSAARLPFGTWNYADANWSVRLRGAPALALCEISATRCWSGGLTVPLRLIDTPDLLQFESDLSRSNALGSLE